MCGITLSIKPDREDSMQPKKARYRVFGIFLFIGTAIAAVAIMAAGVVGAVVTGVIAKATT